jgi:hypothetical protein
MVAVLIDVAVISGAVVFTCLRAGSDDLADVGVGRAVQCVMGRNEHGVGLAAWPSFR